MPNRDSRFIASERIIRNVSKQWMHQWMHARRSALEPRRTILPEPKFDSTFTMCLPSGPRLTTSAHCADSSRMALPQSLPRAVINCFSPATRVISLLTCCRAKSYQNLIYFCADQSEPSRRANSNEAVPRRAPGQNLGR